MGKMLKRISCVVEIFNFLLVDSISTMISTIPMPGDGFGVHGSGMGMPGIDESMEPELDFEADLRAQDAWRESQLLQETGGLGSMTRGLMRPGGRHTVVCKHWLRDLCMKSDKCDFLHQYDLARMPECLQWARFGKCPDNDCDFRHDTERMECQKYKFGFCKLGAQCRMRHDKVGRAYLPEVMPDWYLKELVPNIFDFVPPLPEEVVRVSAQPEAATWNVPMVPQDAWAAPVDAWAAPVQPVVDLTTERRPRKGGKGAPRDRPRNTDWRGGEPAPRESDRRTESRDAPRDVTRPRGTDWRGGEPAPRESERRTDSRDTPRDDRKPRGNDWRGGESAQRESERSRDAPRDVPKPRNTDWRSNDPSSRESGRRTDTRDAPRDVPKPRSTDWEMPSGDRRTDTRSREVPRPRDDRTELKSRETDRRPRDAEYGTRGRREEEQRSRDEDSRRDPRSDRNVPLPEPRPRRDRTRSRSRTQRSRR